MFLWRRLFYADLSGGQSLFGSVFESYQKSCSVVYAQDMTWSGFIFKLCKHVLSRKNGTAAVFVKDIVRKKAFRESRKLPQYFGGKTISEIAGFAAVKNRGGNV